MKRIKSIIIKNSPFFEDVFKIEFSEKLNCLMGGRGTGKSTILYFIKAALEYEAEENRTISSILKSNLENGTITIELMDNDNKSYQIIKTFGEDPQPYTLPQNKHLSLESLNASFECDIYPALAIEEIGKNSYDRLKLIDKKIKNKIDDFKHEIKRLQISLEQNANSIRTENARVNQIKEQLLNFKTVEDDLKRHKEEKPEDIKQEEQKEFEKADENEKIRNTEKRYTKKVIDKLNEIQNNIKEINDDIQNFLVIDKGSKKLINEKIIAKITEEVNSTFNKIITDNEKNIDKIIESLSKIIAFKETLKKKHDQQQNEFFKLKLKFEKHKEYLDKYNQLSKKVEEKNLLQNEIKELELKRKKIKNKRKSLINELNENKREIFDLRKKIIDELNSELEGSVKIILTFGGITDEYENKLRNSLRGSNLRYNALIPYIIQNLTPERFARAIHNKDHDTLKDVAEIDKERSKAIIEALYESKDIYEIESLYCEDLPYFYLKVDSKNDRSAKNKINYKKSDELSTGQRCTTVLPIIFAVSNNPLLIDQPEDNLDNKYITETIHKIIRLQKEERQLIFITHNPNIPVLSDSELNIFLNYDKKSSIEKSGNIEKVKNNILNLLEGGKEAFEKRKVLYGES